MEDRYENIDQFFKSEFENYSPIVPEGMWESIQQKMTDSRKKRVIPLFLRYAAGAAIFIAIGTGLGYFIWSGSDSNTVVSTNLPGTNTTDINQEQTVALIGSLDRSQKPINTEVSFRAAVNQEFSNSTVETPAQNRDKSGELILSNRDNAITAFQESNVSITEPFEASVVDEKDKNEENIRNNPDSLDLIPVRAETPENHIVFTEKDDLLAENKQDYPEEISGFEKPVYDSKWALGGEAGPQYTYRNITSGYEASSISDINKTETGVVAYAGGVNVEYQPSRRFTIQSGIHYSKMGVSQTAQRGDINNNFSNSGDRGDDDNSESTIVYSFPNTSAEIEGDNIVAPVTVGIKDWANTVYESSSKVQEEPKDGIENVPSWRYTEYIEFPLIARYILIDRKLGMHILGGLSTNVLMSNSVNVESQDNTVSGAEVVNMNKVNYSSTFGFGFGYKMTKQLKLTLEPQFKYYLNQQYSESNLGVHPYAFGVMTGVKYIF